MAYCAVYLNRVYRERNCPEKPEDPLILEKDIPYDANFTFVDFVPSVLAYSSQEVEYHKFRLVTLFELVFTGTGYGPTPLPAYHYHSPVHTNPKSMDYNVVCCYCCWFGLFFFVHAQTAI